MHMRHESSSRVTWSSHNLDWLERPSNPSASWSLSRACVGEIFVLLYSWDCDMLVGPFSCFFHSATEVTVKRTVKVIRPRLTRPEWLTAVATYLGILFRIIIWTWPLFKLPLGLAKQIENSHIENIFEFIRTSYLEFLVKILVFIF